MLHSIIIPCRNRSRELTLCRHAIQRSAALCESTDFQVVMVTDDLVPPVIHHPHEFIIHVTQPEGPFNKPRLVNVGIEHSSGDVLTFLDADAIVGPQFMENPRRLLDDPTLTKLCYRVALLPVEETDPLSDRIFESWQDRPIAREFRGLPHIIDFSERRQPLFGNSQFSIRRDMLGDLRYDEGFVGRGYEDIHMNFVIWKQHGVNYRAEMVTDAPHAMFHIEAPEHDQDPEWGPGILNDANKRRYMQAWGLHRRELRRQGRQLCRT